MPTSTFGKQFEVRHEKAADFVNPTLKKGTAHNDARNDSCNCQLMQSEMAIFFYVMKYLNQKKA